MKADIRDRDYMYKMIVGQLFYDGHQQVAMSLATNLGISMTPPPPSDKLFRMVGIARQFVDETEAREKESASLLDGPAGGLDLEYDADVAPSAPEPSLYETIHLTTHKQACMSAAFSVDGTLVATGSADCSIKILDVERMLARESTGANTGDARDSQHDHPVIRTLYDHIDAVTCIAFHPREYLLASGSLDLTVKYFDFSKAAVRRAAKTVFEVEPIRCMSFHPSGEYLLVGTQHSTVRLYNVETSQCYVSAVPADQHRAAVNDVHFAESARLFATASRDGDVKIWDGVSNRCVETFQRAHDGAEICSVVFTRNGKYILTAGRDSCVKLWELAANRCLIAYTGAGATGPQEVDMPAAFNHTEDYALFPDEKSGSLCSWDARNADRKRLLALGHTGPVRCFAHSPTQPAFITGSDDWRARFWYKRTSS